MSKANSYLLFGSAEQRPGRNLRRQLQRTETYAADHGLEIDQSLRFHVLGLSSHRRQNLTSGRLQDFLRAIKDGLVSIDSTLLVENLDRPSRDHALLAQKLLTEIVPAGVSIVTLSDRRIYSDAELKRQRPALRPHVARALDCRSVRCGRSH